jgi:Low-density lipoprotein receptor domain class A
LTISNDTRLYSTLIPVVISRGLLSECIAYRKANILVSNTFDFREDISHKLLNETCSNNQFTCQTGAAILRPLTRCIDQRYKCNQIIDCEDKSDELSCSIANCSSGYTQCSDGKVCYRKDEQTCGMFIKYEISQPGASNRPYREQNPDLGHSHSCVTHLFY